MRAERDVVVGEVRRQGWVRVGTGLYRREEDPDASADPPGWGDLVAWQEVLPASACVTHLSAARVHGMWLPPLPPTLPVFVSMSDREHRPRRPELKVMRHTQPISTTRRGGVEIATPEETLLVCARHLELLDLVVLGDSALHLGLTSRGAVGVDGTPPTVGRLAAGPRDRLDGRSLGVGLGVAAAGDAPGVRRAGRAAARRTRRRRGLRRARRPVDRRVADAARVRRGGAPRGRRVRPWPRPGPTAARGGLEPPRLHRPRPHAAPGADPARGRRHAGATPPRRPARPLARDPRGVAVPRAGPGGVPAAAGPGDG